MLHRTCNWNICLYMANVKSAPFVGKTCTVCVIMCNADQMFIYTKQELQS